MTVLSEKPSDIHESLKEAVVDSLLNDLWGRVAGVGEFHKTIVGMKPSAALLSGFILPVPEAEREGDEESNPIQISAHGLDFQVDGKALGQTIAVTVQGSVYVRILPEAAEVQRGARLYPAFPLRSEVSKALKNHIREGLKALREELAVEGRSARMHPDWAARSEALRRKVHESFGIPFDNQLDRTSENEDAAAEPIEGEDAPPEKEAYAAAELPDNLVETVSPPQKWLRLDLNLPGFSFSLSSYEADAVKAVGAMNSAIREQLEAWAETTEGDFAGKFWGYRPDEKIRPSDIANWEGYLLRVRASGKKPVLPNIELRWDVAATADPLTPDALTTHVALENWSEIRATLRNESEQAFFCVSVGVRVPKSMHRYLTLDRVKPSYRYNEYLKYPALGFNSAVLEEEGDEAIGLTTTWAPRYVLPRIIPTDVGVNLNIEHLSGPDGLGLLENLVPAYEVWLHAVRSHPVDAGIEGPNAQRLRQREQERLASDIQNGWERELRAIKCGLAILKKSREAWKSEGHQKSPLAIPFEAWSAMNAAMAMVARSKGYKEWRLFQVGFILATIPAFVTRIPEFHEFYDEATAVDSNAVTLLYFATGGGKSEAFLGLLLFVLFLDRLRGKACGVSALMRYPLRLLTLQQARRTLKAMAAAEFVRFKRSHGGEPFSLGFWVGSSNTPNWHSDEDYEKVPLASKIPPSEEARAEATNQYLGVKARWQKLENCPFCDSKVALRRQSPSAGNALGHYCMATQQKCSWNARYDEPVALPFYVVDEDIYDLAPSVLLGTVDKLAALGQSPGTIRKFFGMFGFAPFVEVTTGRLFIPKDAKEWSGEPGVKFSSLYPAFADGAKRFFDPFPALLIQDEAHLLDESLGTFAGLFESALDAGFDELASLDPNGLAYSPGTGKRRKIKVIAASATVSEPECQMRNLYLRDGTIQFPFPGPSLYSSFYAEPNAPDDTAADAERRLIPENQLEHRSHWARVYAAILTNGHRHTVAMAGVLGHYHLLITTLYEQLRSGDGPKQEAARSELLRWVSARLHPQQFTRLIQAATPAQLLTLVDLHRISLTYVTNKKGGDQVIDTEKVQFGKLHQAAGYSKEELRSQLITGAVSAAEIQDVVRMAEMRVAPGNPFPDLNSTLRSIIATSAISHGVDVEEFNAMFFAGMPSDIAEYIQASSRIGRTHVGFSLLVPIPQRARDRFIFEIHDIFHRFLERMILPAAVDRWAEKALERVLPSFFQEYLCGIVPIREISAASASDKARVANLSRTTEVKAYLDSPPQKQDVQRFLAFALGLEAFPGPAGEAYYKDKVKTQLSGFHSDLGHSRFANPTKLGTFFKERAANLAPMTSLRDVDEPGIIRASRKDAGWREASEELTAEMMDFIRHGPDADAADGTDQAGD